MDRSAEEIVRWNTDENRTLKRHRMQKKKGDESRERGMRKTKENKANKIALPIAKEETSACLLLHCSLEGMEHQIGLFIPFSIIGNCVGSMLEGEQNRSREEEK